MTGKWVPEPAAFRGIDVKYIDLYGTEDANKILPGDGMELPRVLKDEEAFVGSYYNTFRRGRGKKMLSHAADSGAASGYSQCSTFAVVVCGPGL